MLLWCKFRALGGFTQPMADINRGRDVRCSLQRRSSEADRGAALRAKGITTTAPTSAEGTSILPRMVCSQARYPREPPQTPARVFRAWGRVGAQGWSGWCQNGSCGYLPGRQASRVVHNESIQRCIKHASKHSRSSESGGCVYTAQEIYCVLAQ